MDALNLIYRLKEVIVPPDRYLCANFEKIKLEYGRVVWSTSCVDDLNSAIGNVNNTLGLDKKALKNYVDG